MTSPASCRLSRPAVAEDGLTSPTVSPGLSATGSNRPRVAAIALPPPTSGTKAASAAPPTKFRRPEEHTSELQSLMRISYAVFCLEKNNTSNHQRLEEMKRANLHSTSQH